MDEYTDKTYQGTGFTGERMGSTQAPPPPPSVAQPPAPADPGAPQSEWPASDVPAERRWDYTNTADDQTLGLMFQGGLAGFFFGLIGIAAVAFFSATEKRNDRVMGSVIGLVVQFALGIVYFIATA